ncbi:MAG TPA: diguanylate cyclase [Gammaproteobacteria bacterium]|nr:diguanylate cyclase [Gammaproteobacteria bacterium]
MELSDTALLNVRGRQLDRLLRESRLECSTGMVGLALAVLALLGHLAQGPLFGWAGLTAATYAARYAVLGAYRRASSTAQMQSRWQILFVATLLGTALAWGGMTAWVAAARGLIVGAPLLLLAIAVSIATVTLLAGSLPSALASTLGTLLPPVFGLLLLGNREGLLVAVALVFVGVVSLLGARLLHQRLWEASLLHGENEQLRGYLDQRRDQIEKLHVELKTTQSKREQVEQSLRRNAADLGLVQGKAKALAETLERISPLDQVTGLDNRRHFDQTFDAEWRRAARDGKPVAMLIVEVDDFETYVETYGRQSADVLLKRIGQTLKGFGRRAGDTAGRYDDSRLALILPGCDARNATRIAEALRKRVESQHIAHAQARGRSSLTVHLGVAMLKPTRSMLPAELVKRVEAALYEARFQGGNKVVAYQPLNKLRLERWDLSIDGVLSEQSLIQKLLVWGYDTHKELLQPGGSVEPRILTEELVLATLGGDLKIDVEGHTMTLKAGDCVFVPAGVEAGMEVVGAKPVMKFTAARHR